MAKLGRSQYPRAQYHEALGTEYSHDSHDNTLSTLDQTAVVTLVLLQSQVFETFFFFLPLKMRTKVLIII